MRCLFAISIWGTRYIDNFVRLTLPMQMGPGNLGGLPDIESCKYVIFTRADDVEYIFSTPQIQALKRLMPVEIIPVDVSDGDKYQMLGGLQNLAFCKAIAEGFEAVFPLYADALFADGTFANAVKRLSEGYLAVVAPGPQAVAEPVLQALLDPERYMTEAGAIAVPPRDLVDLVFRHLHPFHAASFWDAEKFTGIPAMVFWNVPGQGVLVHGFHLHPVAVAAQQTSTFLSPFYGTLDEHFLPRLFTCADRVYVGADSDEIFVCSIDSVGSERGGDAANAQDKATVATLASWAEHHTFMLHRDFFGFPIRLHTRDIDEAAWSPCEVRAQRIVDRTLQRLVVPDETLKLEDISAYNGRLYHRGIQQRVLDALQMHEPMIELAKHALGRTVVSLIQRQLADRLVPSERPTLRARLANGGPPSWIGRLPTSSRRLLSLPVNLFERRQRRQSLLSWLRPAPLDSPDAVPSTYRRIWSSVRDSYYDPELLRWPLSKISRMILIRCFMYLNPRFWLRQNRQQRSTIAPDKQAFPPEARG
jgi:hypothetical protein